ncbi:MAG: DNA-binding protein [Cenarchaeum sp. SB0665_bin_23]|nr:DNA-binding protein [Cenarchaeum sp. SB0667_bin_13]MXY38101.1 DNA-binding protein [Cenarchaeum sp. SB0664_bin_35]MXY61796.1 DNA-binding protein [Cenarchaeum sp. SB0665_bin_23]MXZ93135.1 DNA-binding protein [Cenarchaeum sp. SB0666_bin_15]MYB46187.1 DNA-binding protein [Cenarchaeum sp. SB0662_bin_33]MYC79416.1 DNA-binding protein [Cenarchaeum sp. SB0661_bin_35]MYD58001.1 DNA-binding protein [Cenarchaeum sp. SB0678_bin_8]MYG32485.1 DNA-binding protein [Cenarchaeum sp. SB0677_bin_16]MYI51224
MSAPEFGDEQGNEAAEQKDILLRKILDPESRLRLGNVRMVRPDLATQVENYLVAMMTQGRLNPPVTDEQLKQILLSLQQPRRNFKMSRV